MGKDEKCGLTECPPEWGKITMKYPAASSGVLDPRLRNKEITKPVDESSLNEVTTDIIPVASEQTIEKLLDENRCYRCNLSGVNLSRKDLSGADLEGSDLSGAILVDTDLTGANLKGVSLQGAQLKNADLRKADLYKADLSNADLTDADFRGTQLDEANFSGAQGYHPSVMNQ